MSRRLGMGCILLGICCLLLAAGLVAGNIREENSAEKAAEYLLQDVRGEMEENSGFEIPGTGALTNEAGGEMPVTRVGDYDCIGILSIPVLELELPVLTDWTYEKLKTAPCLYYGTYYEENFVIAAHNYQSHFGRLSELQEKDLVLFTDVTGTVRCYEVVLLETLPSNATEQMITSGFDLSLYTCTPGGGNRVTVRCSAVEE